MCHGAAAQLYHRRQMYHRAQLYNYIHLVAIDRIIQLHKIVLFRFLFEAVVVMLWMQTVLHLILQ